MRANDELWNAYIAHLRTCARSGSRFAEAQLRELGAEAWTPAQEVDAFIDNLKRDPVIQRPPRVAP